MVQQRDRTRLNIPHPDRITATPIVVPSTSANQKLFMMGYTLYEHLERLANDWRDENDIPRDLHLVQPTPILQNRSIDSVRIVSDNLTVLKWTSGEYKISHPNKKKIIEEIKWCTAMIEEEFDIHLIFQWTRSHTFLAQGNNYADQLARLGSSHVDRRRAKIFPGLYDEWSFYQMNGVSTIGACDHLILKWKMTCAPHYPTPNMER